MIRLRIDDGRGRRDVELDGDRLTIGRSPECEIVVASSGASRQHAELTREKDAWTVRDLGSSNGTFVNDARIEETPVSPGDVIGIGDEARIEFVSARAASRPSKPAPRERDDAGADDAGEAPAAKAPRARRAPWMQAQWQLFPVSQGQEEFLVRGPVQTVGRDDGVGLHIEDPSISRMHARLDLDGERFKVTDLKSSNGTFVNDARVPAATLAPGDRVRFGDVEFEVRRHDGVAWGGLTRALLVPLVVLVVLAVVVLVASRVMRSEREHRAAQRFRVEAIETLKSGVEAAGRGEAEVARGFFAHAVQEYQLSGEKGAESADERTVLRTLARELPEEMQGFDFAAALDPSAVQAEQSSLDTLDLRSYVEHKLRAYCADLGQDPNLPPEFVDQVWHFVDEFQKYPGSMRVMLRRARTMQPRIEAILARERLSPSVGYVAWVESELDPMKVSPAKAVGLWQLMPATARQYALRVDESSLALDERTDVDKSTRAAARYLAEMLRDQGPEYYMLVLASYNRGHNALRAAKQKVEDPNLRSTEKYWYLVKNGLLAKETREYVPKILAVRLIAESPARFGF